VNSKESGPDPGSKATITNRDIRSTDNTHIARHLRARRAASWRLPQLDCGRRSDPWWYEPPSAGYEEAAAHLVGLMLTPAPNRVGLQRMWKRGGYQRRDAKLIVARWGLVA
jgi:hypothetical protein